MIVFEAAEPRPVRFVRSSHVDLADRSHLSGVHCVSSPVPCDGNGTRCPNTFRVAEMEEVPYFSMYNFSINWFPLRAWIFEISAVSDLKVSDQKLIFRFREYERCWDCDFTIRFVHIWATCISKYYAFILNCIKFENTGFRNTRWIFNCSMVIKNCELD